MYGDYAPFDRFKELLAKHQQINLYIDAAQSIIRKLMGDGYFINSAAFPATPMRRGGLRFRVSRHLTMQDIDELMDDDFLKSHNVYKQALFQTVHRAKELNCKMLDLAYTAILERKKVGTRPERVHAIIQSQNLCGQTVLSAMAAGKAS
jgi:hypothetical protein